MLHQRKSWLLLGFWLHGALAMAGPLIGVTPDELKSLQQEGAKVIDIRTPEEWRQTGLISDSEPLMYFDARGGYDADGWVKKLGEISPGKEGKIVLVCRSGNRSGTVGKMLAGERGYSKIYHLEKGIREWAAQGEPVVALHPLLMV